MEKTCRGHSCRSRVLCSLRFAAAGAHLEYRKLKVIFAKIVEEIRCVGFLDGDKAALKEGAAYLLNKTIGRGSVVSGKQTISPEWSTTETMMAKNRPKDENFFVRNCF